MKSLLSPRLYKLYRYLKTGEKTGQQIQHHTNSMAVHSDVNDLRNMLFYSMSYYTVSKAIYKGMTYSKKRIFAYKLVKYIWVTPHAT
jgi:hypothetical protein